jgi:hypothetical protein
MAFGYQQLYANGLNNNTQLRRATDMIYQRGANYNIVLTGSTFESSMELDIDLYSDETKVGRMQLVPFDVKLSGGTYFYNFNLRPYNYLSNYVQSEHFQYYWLNDWFNTTQTINIDNPYPNSIKANFKYGYRYINSSGATVTEYTGSTPTNDLYHYSFPPECGYYEGLFASGATNTGNYFNYIGGTFQMNNNYFTQNFDQEIGTPFGDNASINSNQVQYFLSPIHQYIMDYPTLPEQSETARFLTDAPRIQYIQADDNYSLYFLNGQTGDKQVIEANYAVFEFYDELNELISSTNVVLSYTGTTFASPTGYTDNLSIYNLPCGPADINNIYTEIDFAEVAYYRVQLFYSFPTDNANNTLYGPVGPISEIFYFYLYDNCQPENTRIVFLNNNGGYDYYTFKSYRQDTKKITSQTYDSRYFSTDLAGPDINLGRSVKTFGIDVAREIVLESEFLTVPVAQWIEQLFYSPQVYILDSDYISPMDRDDKVYKSLRPVQVLSTEVETITKKHRKLNKYRITLKYADTFFANQGF